MWHRGGMTQCLLPAVFAAAQGMGPPVSVPVPRYGPGELPWAGAPPPSGVKPLPGPAAAFEVGTENFTIQWDSASVDEGFAVAAGDLLEEAWQALVERDGWDPPMTSDSFKILVWLTPELAAAGLATGDATEAFPAGQPVIYLNPDWLEDASYRKQVVHHEFVHTLQFHLRDWYAGAADEAWYWEATAEWLPEHVDPAANGQAWIASLYADAPGVAFDTVDGGHEYAMFLLNAYIDTHMGGLASLQSIWLENEGLDWLGELERVLEVSPEVLWAGFAGAYYSRQLPDSHLYALPTLQEGPGVIEGRLGARYMALAETQGQLSLESGIGTLVRDGEWLHFTTTAPIPPGDTVPVLVVTNPGEEPLEVAYEVEVIDRVADTGHTDTGVTDTGDGSSHPSNDGAADEHDESPSAEEDSKARGGCAAVRRGPRWVWVLALLGLRRRFA